MMKQTTLLTIAAFGLVTSANAAPFLDDFSSDTSANYTGTQTFGSGGSFAISGGKLNVGGGGTYDVFHNTARLAVGETVSVDVAPNGSPDFYLTVSTTDRGPNTGTEDGIRLNVQNGSNIRSRIYNNGSLSTANYGGSYNLNLDYTLYITRNSDSNFTVAYDNGSGVVSLDTYDVAAVGSQELYVGVERFGSTMAFDNLQIVAVPEPGSLALLGLGGLCLLRRRRGQV